MALPTVVSMNEKALLENSLCGTEASLPQPSLWVGRLIFLSQMCAPKTGDTGLISVDSGIRWALC